MWRLCTYTPQETHDLGWLLGEFVPPGANLALCGEMGAGKTLFAQGLAGGLGVEEYITSPTFTVANQYFSGRLAFVHMDLFRLNSVEEVWERGLDEYLDGRSVVLAEWPQLLQDIWPAEYLEVRLQKHYDEQGGEWRSIELLPHGELPWLEEAMKHCENFVS